MTNYNQLKAPEVAWVNRAGLLDSSLYVVYARFDIPWVSRHPSGYVQVATCEPALILAEEDKVRTAIGSRRTGILPIITTDFAMQANAWKDWSVQLDRTKHAVWAADNYNVWVAALRGLQIIPEGDPWVDERPKKLLEKYVESEFFEKPATVDLREMTKGAGPERLL